METSVYCNALRFNTGNLLRAAAAVLALGAAMLAQTAPDKVTVPLTDPARPAMVKVNLINGGITVKGYEGKDVVVEARPRSGESSGTRTGGMKRIPINTTGLTV